jgi:ABC-type oligopeptide transport system substrate-binding subunit
MQSSDRKEKRGLDKLTAGMRPQDAAVLRQQFSRRSFLKGAAGAGAGLAAAGMLGSSVFASPGNVLNAIPARAQTPVPLPDGAAAADQQVWRIPSDPAFAKSLDFYETVYNRAGGADLNSEPLVRINRNFEIVPAAAAEWSGSADGKTWTFKLLKTLMWSDGNKVTAADYVKTFQYAADPEHAWDFSWFWSGNIVNFTEAVAGKVPVDQIGVKQGADEFEVVFTTIDAAPYMPSKLLYSMTLSKAALEKSGAFYNNKPETAVSSGPFILEEWVPDQQLTLKRNEAYTGTAVVPIQKIVAKFAASSASFTMYESDEIDQMEGPAPAELKLAKADPDMAKEIYQGVGDFASYYFFFDVKTAPWDNIKVRQAFSHIVDRDAMKQQIWDTQANQGPSYLAPGFPASNVEALKDIQKFDPDAAKKLLAEAGFPDGKGFPAVTITQRGGAAPLEVATIQAYASMVKQYLNIDVQIQNLDRQAFYDGMSKIPLGFVSYGMDYLDPSNMLGVWTSGGRHSWSNPDFDAKIKAANVFLGDPAERIKMFQDAEKLLVSDVPAAFTFFITPNQLVKSYVAGPWKENDKSGISAIHWPGYATMSTVPEELWIGKDAPSGRS